MIRREIVTGGAVAAAFLLAGFLTAPERKPPTVLVDGPADARDAEPPEGYMPHTQPFLSWPDAQPQNPTLTWPPYGCDAGMWSIPYEVTTVEPGRTRVIGTDHQDVETSVDILHEPDWDFDFYPLNPKDSWVVTTSPVDATMSARYLDHGTETCQFHQTFVGQDAEARAIASEDGMMLYVLSDATWAVVQLDNDCEVVGERTIPRELATPPRRTFGLDIPEPGGPRAFLVGAKQVVVEGSTSAALPAAYPVDKLGFGTSDDGIWVIFWDAETTYLHVLELDGTARWSEQWARHPYRDPVTHVALREGFLSVRGPLDSHPADEDLVRVFDTHAPDIVGGERAEALAPRPMVWRWPSPGEADTLTSCLGGGGLFGGCDGELITRKLWEEDGRARVEITRDEGAEPRVCATGFVLPAGAELRGATTMDHGLGIYARTSDELVGWELDLDCELIRETSLPAALLSPRAITEVRDGTKYPSYFHYLNNRSTLLIAAEGELGQLVFSKHIDLEPAATPLSHVDVVGEYFVVRGALDTPPWSIHRDRTRAYDIRTGEEVLTVDR